MMILNPTDSDLQKAIDDITKTTSVEPMFSDPVAAPSTVPEGDDGGIDEAVGPFPEPKIEAPEPKIEVPEPKFEPLELPEVPPIPAMPVNTYAYTPAKPEPVTTQHVTAAASSTEDVKQAALRDLMPLLTKMNINPSQKFRIYQDAFHTLRDESIIKFAYDAAKEIADDNERGEALLKIVTGI